MKKEFRSRGIRLMKNIDYNIPSNIPNSKIYYNSNSVKLDNIMLQNYVNKGVLEYFEYSELENGEIDTFNFHNNLENICSDLYRDLSENELRIINEIPFVFDKTFRNYTIGYRLRNKEIVSSNFYFYPTIWKETRFGIKGIVDKNKIKEHMNSFVNKLDIQDIDTKLEITEFFSKMIKFKGISISFSSNREIEYKIYARINTNEIQEFFEDKVAINIDKYKQYGEVALISQRIKNNQILGYNIYYVS
ncbi:MAG: hypothetical protein ACRCXT_10385 [Paraclostridium sp.]